MPPYSSDSRHVSVTTSGVDNAQVEANTNAITQLTTDKASLNGSTSQAFQATSLLLHDQNQATSGAMLEEFFEHGSSISNISLAIKDETQVALSSSDAYGNIITRDVYVGAGLDTTDFKSVLDTLDANTNALTTKASINGSSYESFNTNHLFIKSSGDSEGVDIRQLQSQNHSYVLGSVGAAAVLNKVVELKDTYQETIEESDEHATLIARDLYVADTISVTNATFKSVREMHTDLVANTSNIQLLQGVSADGNLVEEEDSITANHRHTTSMIIGLDAVILSLQNELAALQGSGSVAQVKTFQTRALKVSADGTDHIGYELTRPIGDVHIDLLDINITPTKIGNAIIVSFMPSYVIFGDTGDYGFVCKRKNNVTNEIYQLPFSSDLTPSMFSVIISPDGAFNTGRSHSEEIRIIDESCLDVDCTYQLYARVTDENSTVQSHLFLNGPHNNRFPSELSTSTYTHEGTLSSVTLTEIRA